MKLNDPGVCESVAEKLSADIDSFCAEKYNDGHRTHLGASLIGHECSRYLWYVFRWCFSEKFNGRMMRLFNRGHREEERFKEWLEGIGAKVFTVDENGKQFQVSAVEGHFGGSMDGYCVLPERFRIEEPVLLEFKTNGTGRGFEDLKAKGMAISKPQHFAQTSIYGYLSYEQFSHVLYMNINKNDDSIHLEVTKLNHDLAKQMVLKAERIIVANEAPARLSDNPTFHKCSFCPAKDICHRGAIPEKNCRSCKFASAASNAEWHCKKFNSSIPKDFIPNGCGEYFPITSKG